jgi:pilus assembly protein CpaC
VVLSENGAAGVVAVGQIERTTALHADIHMLIEEGAAELLANPNLITDAGTTATFHAGGQLPYMTSTNLGATNVEFKPYGVLLNVRPDVVDGSFIRLKIRAALSAPDGTNGVQLSGNTVPALSEREVTSNVTVSPGMTMTLAGLVQTRKEQLVRGVPFLRRIPLLGALFRWKKSNFRRTTVVVFVTPRFVEL